MHLSKTHLLKHITQSGIVSAKSLLITLLTTPWSKILINFNIFRLLKPKGGQNDINDKLQELIKLREDLLKAKEQVLEDEPEPPSDYIPRRLRPKPIPFEDSNLEVWIEHHIGAFLLTRQFR